MPNGFQTREGNYDSNYLALQQQNKSIREKKPASRMKLASDHISKSISAYDDGAVEVEEIDDYDSNGNPIVEYDQHIEIARNLV